MKTVLFIPTAHTENGQPSPWLKQRLDAAIGYFQEYADKECVFVVSGRGPSVENMPAMPEAEVCRLYISNLLPSAKIIKEDISVETGGNFAFSKPILDILKPDKVVIYNSKVNDQRTRFFAQKIFEPDYKCEFVFLDDELSKNTAAIDKEPRALEMFKNIFAKTEDGDAKAARDVLLYETPFYFKGIISDKDFFDKYWPGGFENKTSTESSKWGK